MVGTRAAATDPDYVSAVTIYLNHVESIIFHLPEQYLIIHAE